MGNFLDEMMGFSNGLIPKARDLLPLFDPALVDTNLLESDDTSDGEGTSLFKTQALQHGSPRYQIPRTRSQSKADESERTPSQKLRLTQGMPINNIMDTINRKKPGFTLGDLVYAHKGQKIPCWFPGLVTEKGKKGMFKVNFLADFGQEFCAIGSIMQFVDYEKRKKEEKNLKLYEIPKKFELNFEKAVVLANELNNAK